MGDTKTFFFGLYKQMPHNQSECLVIWCFVLKWFVSHKLISIISRTLKVFSLCPYAKVYRFLNENMTANACSLVLQYQYSEGQVCPKTAERNWRETERQPQSCNINVYSDVRPQGDREWLMRSMVEPCSKLNKLLPDSPGAQRATTHRRGRDERICKESKDGSTVFVYKC